MRGSGCSGGAFDLFDLPTTYDGYDMVETVAAQRWVKGRKVGMVGISFSGITQLFTAGTRPPHLAADLADVGHRRHVPRDGLPGRHPQLGIRGGRGSPTAGATRGPAPAGGQP
jgi:predicted acyl esterase